MSAALPDHLLKLGTPLFVLLDSAQEASTPSRLRNAGLAYRSLYDGPEGERLASIAPYLAALPPGAPILPKLLEDMRGQSWGIFLTSKQSLDEVRRHLRRFLQVRLPGDKQVLFRFYDPRILSVLLPTCDEAQLDALFGSVIEHYLMEDEAGRGFASFSRNSAGGLLIGRFPER